MQRILFALVALISFLAVNLRPAQSQGAQGKATEPINTAQRIDQPTPPASDEVKGEVSEGDLTPAAGMPTDSARPVVVPAGKTVESITVENSQLVLAGHVRRDVRAINSRITIEPGATIGGRILILSGTGHGHGLNTVTMALPASAAFGSTLRPNKQQGNWFGGQFMLWLIGLFGGLIVLLIAPRASSQVAETAALFPGRSLAVGGFSAIVMSALLAFSGKLTAMHGLVGLLWSPVMALLAIGSLLLLVYGWLTGMRVAGDRVARRFGFPGSGPL